MPKRPDEGGEDHDTDATPPVKHRPGPKPNPDRGKVLTTVVGIRLRAKEAAKLRKNAKAEGITVSEYVRQALHLRHARKAGK